MATNEPTGFEGTAFAPNDGGAQTQNNQTNGSGSDDHSNESCFKELGEISEEEVRQAFTPDEPQNDGAANTNDGGSIEHLATLLPVRRRAAQAWPVRWRPAILRNTAQALRKWSRDEERLVRLPASPIPGFSARYVNDSDGHELKVRTLSVESDGQQEYRIQYCSWDKENPSDYTADGVPESWPVDGEETFTIRTDDIGGLLTDIQLDLSLPTRP